MTGHHSWGRRAGQKVAGLAAGQKPFGGSHGRTGWSPKRKTPTVVSKGLSDVSWRSGEGEQLPQLLKR